MIDQIKKIVEAAQHIVVLQADNPDADSLGSALALEDLLVEQGKSVTLYCSVDPPTYLRHINGWDRVQNEIPNKFDASIIVDASTLTLFDKLNKSGQQSWVATKPCIVLDHHETTDDSINFANVVLNDPSISSTGELVYNLAKELKWTITPLAGSCIMNAIQGDTQGLTNQLTKSATYRVMADLTKLGVSRPELEEARREFTKMDRKIFDYKSTLISRTEFHVDGQIALVTIPQAEINEFSPLYNPAPLIQQDMLQTIGVKVAIVLKSYNDGKILASIRANTPIAAQLAEHFGGGGHNYASGFKLENGEINQTKSDCIKKGSDLIKQYETI